MSQCERAAGHNTANCCPSCHGLWDAEGVYMADGFTEDGYDLHVCCVASNVSRSWIKEHRVKKKLKPPPENN